MIIIFLHGYKVSVPSIVYHGKVMPYIVKWKTNLDSAQELQQRTWVVLKSQYVSVFEKVLLPWGLIAKAPVYFISISIELFKKKRFTIDGGIIKVGTTFYGRKYIGTEVEVHNTCLHLGCDARQLFKIDDCRIPFGLIIRLLKRRQFIGEPDFKKQRLSVRNFQLLF